jgi:hypothetical protein
VIFPSSTVSFCDATPVQILTFHQVKAIFVEPPVYLHPAPTSRKIGNPVVPSKPTTACPSGASPLGPKNPQRIDQSVFCIFEAIVTQSGFM